MDRRMDGDTRSFSRRRGGLSRRVGLWLGAATATLVLAGTPTLAQTTATAPPPASADAGAPSHVLPALDLYIYADQSKSVFDGPRGQRPADTLVEMIRQVIQQPIASDRNLLGGNGQLALYGFAGKQSGRRLPVDCGSDVRTLIEEATAGRAPEIAGALDRYSNATDDYNTTNFECLFEHIAGNPRIKASVAQGRQAVILIASDFLHDPFNLSSAPASHEAVQNGYARAGEGICDLTGQYRDGKMPTTLADPLASATKLTDGAADSLPPLYGLLELRLETTTIASGNSRYAACVREMAGNVGNRLSDLVARKLEADRFDFGDDPAAFAAKFRDTVLARSAPAPIIQSAEASRVPDGRFKIKAVLTSQSGTDMEIIGFSYRSTADVDWRDVDVALESGSPALPAGGKIELGWALAALPSLTADTPIHLAVRFHGAGSPIQRRTKPYTARPNDRGIRVEMGSLLLPQEGTGTLEIGIANDTDRPLTLSRLAIGRTEAGATDVPSSDRGGRVLPAKSKEALTLSLPSLPRADLSNGLLSLFVAAINADGVEYTAPGEKLRPEENKALTVESAELVRQSTDDTNPTLLLRVHNANRFPVSLTSVALKTGGETLSLRLTAPKPIGKSVVEEVSIAATDLVDPAQIQEIRRTFRDGVTTVAALAPQIAQSAPSPPGKVTFLTPPEIACPSTDRPDSQQWKLVSDLGATLTLRFAGPLVDGYPTIRPKSYQIDGLAGSHPVPPLRRLQSSSQTEVAEFDIDFHDDDRKRLKHRQRDGSILIRVTDSQDRLMCGGPIAVAPHAASEPRNFAVIDGSFDAQRDKDLGQILSYKIYHLSKTSLHVVDQVRMFPTDQPAREGEPVGATIDGQQLGTEQPVYIEPGLNKAATVQIRLQGTGISPGEIRNYSVRHMNNGEPVGDARVELPHSSVEIGTSAWLPDEPTLAMTLTSSTLAEVREVLLSATRNPGSERDVLRLPFKESQVLGQKDARIEVQAPLPTERQRQAIYERILASQDMYACVLPEGYQWTECSTHWPPIEGLPPGILLISGEPNFDPIADAVHFDIRNDGIYLDTLNSVELEMFDGQRLKLDLEEPQIAVPPGTTQSVSARLLSPEDRQHLLSDIRFKVVTTTHHRQSVTSDWSAAIRPQIALDAITIHRIDPLDRLLIYGSADLVHRLINARGTIRPPQPVITGEIRLERGAPLAGITAQVGILDENQKSFRPLLTQKYLPKLETNRAQQELSIPFAIEIPESLASERTVLRAQALLAEDGQVPLATVDNLVPLDDDNLIWATIRFLALAVAAGSLAQLTLSRVRRNHSYMTQTLLLWVMFVMIGLFVIGLIPFAKAEGFLGPVGTLFVWLFTSGGVFTVVPLLLRTRRLQATLLPWTGTLDRAGSNAIGAYATYGAAGFVIFIFAWYVITISGLHNRIACNESNYIIRIITEGPCK